MAEETPPPTNTEQIEDLSIERELQDSYLTYAMSTIMDRALPDVRDGLKPSQRRILVAMNDLNLAPNRKPLKCAKIAGDTSGNYHPHGEAVIYLDTWVRDLAPNTSYLLQRAVDTTIDGDCTSTSWLTLGKGLTPQAITTGDRGTGREALFRSVAAFPVGSEFDIHFRVIDEATGKTGVLDSWDLLVGSRWD